ncbi:MAG: S8 family serine peptidase [Bacteriovorax sp.]|nr:S8 family serine peptidase [Bacteriovorax sp.]
MKKILIVLWLFFGFSSQKSWAQTTHRYIISTNDQTHFLLIKNQISDYTKNQKFIQSSLALDQLNVFIIDSALSLNKIKNSFEDTLIEEDYLFPIPKWNKNLFKKNESRHINLFTDPTWNVQFVKAPQAWAQGYFGQNTRVMLLDSGIDKDHPSIKDNFEKGQDFAGGVNKPYAYFDSIGHGTHTSGIVLGQSSPKGSIGVAPQAKLLMARVCSSTSCSASAVLKGLNWALQEKVDVVNLSLSKPESSQAEVNAIKKLEDAGIVVVASSGNDGKANVLYPAALPTVISVGSVNENLAKSVFSNWGETLDLVAPGDNILSASPIGKGALTQVLIDEKSISSATFVGAPITITSFSSELINCTNGLPTDFPNEVKGKTALIKRGDIRFIDKLNNAIKAGAKAVIFYNNESGLVVGDLHGKVQIPVALVLQNDGEKIIQDLASGQVVHSKISNSVSDYVYNSGTSMATPHVAGVVALIKSKNKNLTPVQIRNILANGAVPFPVGPENYFGAGLVDAEKSLQLTPN